MYTLTFSSQSNLLPQSNDKNLEKIHRMLVRDSDDLVVISKLGNKLVGFKYLSKNDLWMQSWSEAVFRNAEDHPLDNYLWQVIDVLGDGNDAIILRSEEGIRFYRLQNAPLSGLKLLATDGRFHDIAGWNDKNHELLWGRFYPNAKLIGVFARDENGNIKLYSVNTERVLANHSYPLFDFKKHISFSSAWKSIANNLCLTKLNHLNPESIVLRSAQGLEFYQFTAKYEFERFLSTPKFMKPPESSPDYLFFADLTHQKYQDIIHLNDSGLLTYKYDDNYGDYMLVHHHRGFMLGNGWLHSYSRNVQLFDLNNDGRLDLLFTGSQGLTALTFDPLANKWNMLLDPEELPITHRYVVVIGTLPSSPPTIAQPSLFVRDPGGKVMWAKIHQTSTTATTKPQSTKSTSTTTELPQFANVDIPEQIARKYPKEKPDLRWVEQWAKIIRSSFKEAVDPADGQIRLSIPLADFYTSTGWSLQIAMTYSSLDVNEQSDLLGGGWSLSLAQDCVFVDHQGSIYSDDFRYYLKSQGTAQLLKLKTDGQHLKQFQLTNSDEKIDINYNVNDQCWVIEGELEQLTYGKTQDAIKWSLGWPNWRGQGSDAEGLQRITTAWYLIKRFDKANHKTLFYQYENDIANVTTKKYTAALRLKTITDQKMQLDFNYAPKTLGEYTKISPVDDAGNIIFPVPLSATHYLQGYHITTATYTQKVVFDYQISNKVRLLTSVHQQLASQEELILQLNYKKQLEKQVLESCAVVPLKLGLTFTYDQLTPPLSVRSTNKVINYPFEGNLKIATGANYTVMSYQKSDFKIILVVMNRPMTQVLMDCSTKEMDCPIEHAKIEDYMVRAYTNSFLVFMQTTTNIIINSFDRKNQEWSRKPTKFSFGKDELVRFTETIIAAADPNKKSLELHEKIADHWKSTVLTVSRPIVAIVVQNKLIIFYDKNDLQLFHLDTQSNWKHKVISASPLGTPALERFELDSEIKQLLSKNLNLSGLQVFNNIVLLTSILEESGDIFSCIHLFLMDSQFNVTKHQKFIFKKETVSELSYKHTQDGSTFEIRYVENKGSFKAIVKSVSGKLVEKVEAIRNRNLRYDAMQKMLAQINEDKQWRDILKKTFIIDWSLYQLQINQQGVLSSNDTLLRFTGTEWNKEEVSKSRPLLLGDHFVLEALGENKVFVLYKQDNNNKKVGKPLQELCLKSSGQLINRYPVYIAYHNQEDVLKVVSFKNPYTLGAIFSYSNEKYLPESDWQNLITEKTTWNEPNECLVRPVMIFNSADPHLVIKRIAMTGGDIQRLTGYQRAYGVDHVDETYFETISEVPSDNKNVSGWYETTIKYPMKSGNVTKTDQWFDNLGKPVPGPVRKEPLDNNQDKTDSMLNPALLLDRSGNRIISDFSPYSLDDEMGSYYGFESYENNYVSISPSNIWKLEGATVIEKKFAFTGENYLQLGSTSEKMSSFLEGTLVPKNQEIAYLASAWVRPNEQLTLDKPYTYLKAIISIPSGEAIINLLGQTKRQSGDWFYIELPIDFRLLKQIYWNYVTYNAKKANKTIPYEFQTPKFKITLRAEASFPQTIDFDHIRFSPLVHDFQASVYHPLFDKTVAVIESNGRVSRTIYNNLLQEIANINDDGQTTSLCSVSHTGHLAISPQGSLPNFKMPNSLLLVPEQGLYETFDAYSLRHHWKTNDPSAWKIGPGQLWHTTSGKNKLQSHNKLLNTNSLAVRLYFALQEHKSSISLSWEEIGELKLIHEIASHCILILPNGNPVRNLPLSGELIVMLDSNFIWVWLNGVLLIDLALGKSGSNSFSPFAIVSQGMTLIEDMILMSQPQLTVEYQNNFGEKSQVILFEDVKTALVSEMLHDELGRAAITTKSSRIHRNQNLALLTYRPKFVLNKNPASQHSVWKTNILIGEVDDLNPVDQGVAFERIVYAPNPLNERISSGLPGPDYSVTGHHSSKISHISGIAFLDNIFPAQQNFSQIVEHLPGGSVKVSVFDKSQNEIARYVDVPGFNHLLSIYEYDGENRLVKMLPPLYHEKVNTASRLTVWNFGEKHLTSQEKQWQQRLATFFSYDKNGHLNSKTTPDSGTTEYIFNAAGQMRFILPNSTKDSTQIVYLDYDNNGQLSRSGYLNHTLSLSDLNKYLESQVLPYAHDHQLFDFADENLDPQTRGRVKDCVTYFDDEVIVEKLLFDSQQRVIAKSVISASGEVESNQVNNFEKKFLGDKLHVLKYPTTFDGQQFDLVHTYNRLGQLVALGTVSDPSHFGEFTYHATGQLAGEKIQSTSTHSFAREYHYNSPGFLTKISDQFLTEEITYERRGYGQPSYGDNLVMSMTFNASWPKYADRRWFQIKKEDFAGKYSDLCVSALKRIGYLTNNGTPTRLYNRGSETLLPASCRGPTENYLSQIIAEKQPPDYYGHCYAYDAHQALTHAKYITKDTEVLAKPLQPESFALKIIGLTNEQSQHIWQVLSKAGFIISDNHYSDLNSAIGKQGYKSIIRKMDLAMHLNSLNSNHIVYLASIEALIIAAISKKVVINKTDFVKTFMYWAGLCDQESPDLLIRQKQQFADEIYHMLIEKGYLSSEDPLSTGALDGDFINILYQYSKFIPDIVNILAQHFNYALGEDPFDVESFEIDANGNHRLFFTGFKRNEISYHSGTNKIASVKVNWPYSLEKEQIFEFEHDSQGNVIKAMHKGITQIKYHPVSQRTTFIKLLDGRSLRFYYDAQGGRVLKRGFDAAGKISHEKFYLRDEQGRVLVDKDVKYFGQTTEESVTTYLYGPRGLLGFIRANDFYSVSLDHLGSVRLILRAGKVVAAYDYLPYGQLMRSHGIDPQVHIVYRYTGQEWDEEIGLYNYHARLYDAGIGRFYQVDPKAQYFSPYKYASNSPLMMVDPDGEFAFLIIIGVAALVGTYLGGAAANNRWNPVDWDFKDPGTWLGMGGGAVAGALLPVGFVASAGTIGVVGTAMLGAGGSYLTMAAANRNFDPSKWEWDRPATWNAMFQGFASGSGIAGGIGAVHSFAKNSKMIASFGNFLGVSRNTAKTIFLTVSYSAGGAMAYRAGAQANDGKLAFWEWDWTNPATLSGLVEGFDTGSGWPQNFLEIGKGLSKIAKNPKFLGFAKGSVKQSLKIILKNPKHPLYKVSGGLVMAYFMGSSANGELDITQWNLASFSTYEGVLNRIFFGKDVSNLLKLARNSKMKINLKLPDPVINKMKNWSRKLIDVMDDLMALRKHIEYRSLIQKSFDSQTARALWVSTLQKKGVSNAVIEKVDTFFKKGLEKWKKGDSEPPTELQHLLSEDVDHKVYSFSKELAKWQTENSATSKKRQEIFSENDAQFLNCRRLARRRRRGLFDKLFCSVNHMEEFKKNPADFFQKNVVSTKSIDKAIPGVPPLVSGKVYDFNFKPVDGSTGKYQLVPTTASADSVKGYWLSTDRTLTVDLNEPKALYIFTGELQSCSLYYRHDRAANTIEIFHYRRRSKLGIYLNFYDGKQIRNGKNNFLDDDGNNIEEIPNGVLLVDVSGNVVEPRDGVIFPHEKLYYLDSNDIRHPVETINGKEISTFIERNNQIRGEERRLRRQYDHEIKYEEYLNIPRNIDILYRTSTITNAASTPLLYVDSKNQWRFVSQRITYKDMTSTESFEMRLPLTPHEVQTNIFILGGGPNVPQPGPRQRRSMDEVSNGNENFSLPESRCEQIEFSSFNSTFSLNQVGMVNERNETVEPEAVNNYYFPAASSNGCSKFQFWPTRLLNQIGKKVLPFLFFNKISHTEDKVEKFGRFPFHDPPQRMTHRPLDVDEPTLDIEFPSLSVLEMGDQWVNNLEIDGVLTWAVLLARKWTGYSPKWSSPPDFHAGEAIMLDALSNELVDEFVKTVSRHALSCGIRPTVQNILEDEKSRNKITRTVRQNFSVLGLKNIPQFLYKKLILHNMDKIASKSTPSQARKLSNKVAGSISRLQQQFIYIESKCLQQPVGGAPPLYYTAKEVNSGIPLSLLTDPQFNNLFHNNLPSTLEPSVKNIT